MAKRQEHVQGTVYRYIDGVDGDTLTRSQQTTQQIITPDSGHPDWDCLCLPQSLQAHVGIVPKFFPFRHWSIIVLVAGVRGVVCGPEAAYLACGCRRYQISGNATSPTHARPRDDPWVMFSRLSHARAKSEFLTLPDWQQPATRKYWPSRIAGGCAWGWQLHPGEKKGNKIWRSKTRSAGRITLRRDGNNTGWSLWRSPRPTQDCRANDDYWMLCRLLNDNVVK